MLTQAQQKYIDSFKAKIGEAEQQAPTDRLSRLTELASTVKKETTQVGTGNVVTDVAVGAGKSFYKGVQDIGKLITNPLSRVMGLKKEDVGISDETLKPVNTAQKFGAGLETAAEFLVPLGATKVTGKLATGAGKLLKVGDKVVDPAKIMQRVARINPSEQVKFEKQAGETVGSYLVNRKIFGKPEKIAEKLVTKFQESKNEADKALATLKGEYKPTVIGTALKNLLKKEVAVSEKGALSPDLKKVNALLNKFNTKGLTMSEINDVKRLYERNIKLDFLKQNLPEGVKKANNIDNAIRTWQFNEAEKLGLQNLPEINKETQLAKQLADAIGKKLAGSGANNAVTLTDWIVLAGGDPTAVGGFLGKKILSSKTLQSKIAEKLSSSKVTKSVTAKYAKPRPDLTDFLKRE